MAGITGISGLIAGFDTRGAVDELLSPRQAEIDRLVRQQDGESVKQNAFYELNTLIRDFRSISNGMLDSDKFFSYTASLTSDNASVPATSLLDVSGTDAVDAGNHTIIVEALAMAQRTASSSAVQDSGATAAASDTSALGLTGSFQINGQAISVTASDSLQEIAGSINAENALTGVTASVVKVADSDFRLTLTSDTTGATGFTLSGADLDADTGGALAGLNIGAVGQSNASQELQAAQDSQVNIDGLTIYRSTNSISDALQGITLDLKQASPTTSVSMSVGIDTAAVQNMVLDFIDAYNAVTSFINGQFAIDNETGERGVLASESILTTVQSRLANSLVSSVSGLASDRNSLVKIGVEPDVNGQLQINETLFTNFLNNDVTAIRDVFVASGSSTNTDINFLVTGTNTPSGSYAVDIGTAATQASVTGSADLVGATLAADETVTVTESGSGRQAIVDLLTGQGQSAIISALNAEFDAEYTESRVFDQVLLDGGSPATGATTFSALGLGVAANDTITITGTNRGGTQISNSFTILDPATDTISDLLSSIQSAYGQQVVASLDGSGRLVVTDSKAGDSQLSVTLTANNEGAGTLSLGVDTTALTTEGRYALGLEAIVSGNGVAIRHTNYGAASGFSISQTVDGLGIANASFSGVDVSGTIGGESATGSGQLLIGNSGNIDNMAISYTGTATGAVGDLVLSAGASAQLDNVLDIYSNPFSGLIQNTILASEGTVDDYITRIADLESQMAKQRELLLNSFAQMESLMASLQQSGSFLTQNIDAMNAASRRY